MASQKKNKMISNRRIFIAGAGAAIIAGAVGLATCSNNQEDQWDFLKITPRDKEWTLDELLAGCVPIGPEEIMYDNDEDYAQFMPHFDGRERWQALSERGLIKSDKNYEFVPTCQYYGVPLPSKTGKQVKEFAKRSEELLYRELPEMKVFDTDWHNVQRGENHTTRFNGKGFVCELSVKAMLMRVREKGTTPPLASLVSVGDGAKPHSGSKSVTNYTEGETRKVNYSFMMIGVGSSLLCAPYSELIPIATREADGRYSKLVGWEKDSIATEAFSEAVSLWMADKAVDEFKIPNGRALFNTHKNWIISEDAPPVYTQVKGAYEVVNEIGPKNAYKIYNENPEKFMQLVRAK